MPSKLPPCPHGPTNTYNLSTPIGEMLLVSCPQGLHSLGMAGAVSDDNFAPDPAMAVALVSQLYGDNGYTYKPAVQCVDWLQAYFCCGRKEQPRPRMCTYIGKEGSFTNHVWQTLLSKVPFGGTVSYQSLANMCGNPRACRAVGQAMRNNPLQLVVPCHRVIAANGGLGNYSSGTRNKMKEWLLGHEGSFN